MVETPYCTPEWTNLKLLDGQVGKRSSPFSLDHSSQLESRVVEPGRLIAVHVR